jgi:hypothetical protein
MIEAYLRANNMFVDYNEVSFFLVMFLGFQLFVFFFYHNIDIFAFMMTASNRKSLLFISRAGP